MVFDLIEPDLDNQANTGINAEDSEAKRPALRGFVVRELSAVESNWRCKESLHAYLERNGIVGITNNGSGSVTVTNSSPVSVNANVTAGGDITITATDSAGNRTAAKRTYR